MPRLAALGALLALSSGGCSLATDFDRDHPGAFEARFYPVERLSPPQTGEVADTTLCKGLCGLWVDCMFAQGGCHAFYVAGETEAGQQARDDYLEGCETECEQLGEVVPSQVTELENRASCVSKARLYVDADPELSAECDLYLDLCATYCADERFQGCPLARAGCLRECAAARRDEHACYLEARAVENDKREFCEEIAECREDRPADPEDSEDAE